MAVKDLKSKPSRSGKRSKSGESKKPALNPHGRLLHGFELEARDARRSGAEDVKLIFKKYYSLPQEHGTTVALVTKYLELYPEIAGQDDFLKNSVLPIPGLREAVTSASPYLTQAGQDQADERVEASSTAVSAPRAAALANSWQDVQIAFLSDERVEICNGLNRETHNYTEFGFEDRRSGKQSLAWETLRQLAADGGTMPRPLAGRERASVQKRIEEIREKLRSHFRIDSDPIPFNGNTYQASFRISRRPSFET